MHDTARLRARLVLALYATPAVACGRIGYDTLDDPVPQGGACGAGTTIHDDDGSSVGTSGSSASAAQAAAAGSWGAAGARTVSDPARAGSSTGPPLSTAGGAIGAGGVGATGNAGGVGATGNAGGVGATGNAGGVGATGNAGGVGATGNAGGVGATGNAGGTGGHAGVAPVTGGGSGLGGFSASAGSAGFFGTSGAIGAGGEGAGGADGPGGARATAGSAGIAGGGGATPECIPVASPIRSWSFDTGVSGWEAYSDDPSTCVVGWEPAAGHEAPGALTATMELVDIDAFTAVRYRQQPLTDMVDRVATVRVLVQSGSDLTAKLYVQTTDYAWADSGNVPVETGVWTCLSLDLANPGYENEGYDPNNVIAIGVRVRGLGEVTVLFDDVAY